MTTRTELSEIAADKDGHTELMRAALNGDTGAVKALLAGGNDANAKDSEGRTALMFAVINGHRDTAWK
jgi:ankyrin repeat protein